jgi:hypothetical protein
MPDGTRLRLRATRVGSSWRTCTAWITEFTSALTAAHLPADSPAPLRSPAARRKASEEAAAELDRIGIK